jgi:hypothetical protein
LSVQPCFGNLDSPRGRLQDFRMQEQNKDGQSLYVTYCNFFLPGMAGLGAAIALADKGHKVRVLGRHPRRQSLGSVIGIILSSARDFGQYGVLEDVWRVCGDRRMTTNFRRWEDGSVLLSQEPAVRESPFGIW